MKTDFSTLACDIHDLVTREGSLDVDTIRERLTVASANRYAAALRELQKANKVHRSGGVIRLPGDHAERPSTLHQARRAARVARAAA
ncbi:hypothetical protein [Solimonas sp. SE-A11]|uniref:hypothetical protein n=1 Tax=Solimonas sp. SE-A11 TaxID=3054954 RepID=UPI00259CF402|nr:hypothetical protein [Solimonas sp. SE-A11]MDM4768649.1 hypothetical protein [Solimonas sp. SE-A11]